MELTGLAARDKILVTLKREGPSFVHELASILGVTPNAVRHQLNVLLADDLVRQSPVRRSVGRPAHLFQLTEKGERLFPDDYAGLALDLLEGIAEKEGLARVDELLARRCRAWMRACKPKLEGKHLAEKVSVLVGIHADRGYMTRLEQRDTELSLINHHCLTHVVACRFPALCKHEVNSLRELLQADVRLEECLAKGDRYCRFVVDAPVDNVSTAATRRDGEKNG